MCKSQLLPKDSQRSGESSGWHHPGPEFKSWWEQILPWVKKILSPLLILKAQAKSRPRYGNGAWHRSGTHMGCGGPCIREEMSSGVFSIYMRRPLFLI
jgi:hypothetical protein